jgi:hypothetical protein
MQLCFNRPNHTAPGPHRTVLLVEELEARQALAAVTGAVAPVVIAGGDPTPAVVQPAGLATGQATVNLTPGTNPKEVFGLFTGPLGAMTAGPVPQAVLAAAAAQAAGNPADLSTGVLPSPANELPPILEGATNLPPVGPVSLTDLRRVQDSFLLGGHNEVAPTAPPSPAPAPTAAHFPWGDFLPGWNEMSQEAAPLPQDTAPQKQD